MTSDLDSRSYFRSAGWPVLARISTAPISEHLGRIKTGALRAVTSIEWNEETIGGLDSDTLRFTTLRTHAGRPGFFITRGRQFAAPGSDYSSTQNLRVINNAAKTGRNALLNYLNDDFQVDATTGFILEDDAKTIDIDLTSQLKASLAGHASAVAGRIGRNDDILRTSTITGEFVVQPKGYGEHISFTLGFTRSV